MSKKSLLLATLLTSLSVFTGCEKSEQKSTQKAPSKISITEILNRPIYFNRLPHAMILPTQSGGHVQLLYPIQEDGMVMESKEQYEKRIDWLNKKFPKDVQRLSDEWMDMKEPLKMPFVSFFDKREYMGYHLQWMKGFKKSYFPQNDPLISWWATNLELHNLLTPKEKEQLNFASSIKTKNER